MLDVGANVGNWTAALLSVEPSARVFAFEPSSTAYAQLATRFAGNPSVELVHAAVGREAGFATLWADRPGSGLASLTQRRLDHFDIEFNHSESVALLNLDTVCATTDVQPVLVKLDVEGHELDVLAGATAVLTQVRVVQFEFGGCNIDTRTFWQDFFYLFTGRGFNLYRLGPHGLDAIPGYSESDECFLTTNYFAVRV